MYQLHRVGDVMTRDRGHRNTNERGNAKQRRARKQWLLNTFGDGESAPCFECGTAVTFDTIFVDRIIPHEEGGTYRRDNIRPHCASCSCKQGANATNRLKRVKALTREEDCQNVDNPKAQRKSA